jgi:AcrR family transcriptional regulator
VNNSKPNGAATSRRRPRDRKRQIVLAARELFVEEGSPHVTVAQIASHVGITAGALYRHFDNKSTLLEEVMSDSLLFLDTPPSRASLEAMVEDSIGIAQRSYPRTADLWTQEMRYLPRDVRLAHWKRLSRWVHSFVPAVSEHRGTTDREVDHFVAWALQSIFACLLSESIRAPAAGKRAAVRAAAYALAAAHFPADPISTCVVNPQGGRAPSSRRERLLLAATEQFSSRGYPETSMTSIGAAADVTGPNIYGYYESKAELLRAVFERTAHLTWAVLDYSLARSSTAEEALEAVVTDFVRLIEYRGQFQFTGAGSFAEATRDEQREFLNEWTDLVCEVVPAIDRQQARLRPLIALRLVADLGRIPSLTGSRRFSAHLGTAMLAILRAPSADPTG